MSSTITKPTPSSVNMTVGSQAPSRALKAATADFIVTNPKSKAVFDNASKHLPAGNTRTTLFAPPFPISAVSGSGSEIISVDGKPYLDMVGEYTAGIYGHSHPKIIAAIQYGLTKGVNLGATGPLEGELAELIKERFEAGAGLEILRFTNSGTEANLLAVATARAWTGRNKILVFKNAYHGAVQSFHKESDPINIPGEYLIGDYNSISSVEIILSHVEPDTLAGILLEPMQGAGGCFPASIEFLQYLRTQATRLNSLLIFDEVMTSRLYYEGGLSGKYSIKPDLLTMGKYLGGGMSFGLFGGRRDIMSLFNPLTGASIPSKHGATASHMMLTHGGTFNNNVMTMYAGIAGAKILTREVLDELNALGDYLRESVSQVLVSHGVVTLSKTGGHDSSNTPNIDAVPRGSMWISGIGSMNTIHFGRKDELADLRDLFYFHLLENGIYPTRRGFIALNIQHTKKDIDRYVAAVECFVGRWEHVLKTS